MTVTTIRNIEQLQLIPEDELIDKLVHDPEGQWFDRKSPRISPRDLADTMVAFANAEGGIVVIGIERPNLVGIGADRKVNEWQQAALTYTEPPVRHRFEFIPCVRSDGVMDQLAVIEVEASERVHQNSKGETLLRVGDSDRRLGPLEAQELRYDKGDSIFDGTIVQEARMADLDQRVTDIYLRRIHGASRPEISLESRGLIRRTRDGKQLRPTVAGIVVLGSDPQRFLPQATLRLLRYTGDSAQTGVRSNVRTDVMLRGNVREQIETARRRLRRWVTPAIRLSAGARFTSGTYIPEYAWLESVVNAVVHRSYSIGGDHPRVHVFDNRVEVESPGRLPGLVRIENIRSTRFARNPRIARAVAELGYGRELGEGVNRMFEEMRAAGLPDPVYSQGPATVSVALLADALSGELFRYLPLGSERFVEHLSRTGRLTTAQAADLLHVSRPTARMHLARLAEVGLLEHAGTSSRDPRGYWRLVRRLSIGS